MSDRAPDARPGAPKALDYRDAGRRGTRLTSALVVGLVWAFVVGVLAVLVLVLVRALP